MDRGPLSPDEQQRLNAWLAEDARNTGAYVRAQAVWQLCGQPAVAGGVVMPRRKPALNRRTALGMGAGALAASLAAAYFGITRIMTPQYSTDIGEMSQKSLSDGSVIALDTASAVTARFDDALRRVQLDKGQALFDVAKDASRPFVVEAGPIRVKAIGTAFVVRRFEDAADVVVTEGVVAVWNVAAPESKLKLAAGQSAMMPNEQSLPAEAHAMTAEQINQKTAWRTGQIILGGETLAYAAAEFNRYNKDKIQIADAALAQKTLVGGFRASDPQGFAGVVATLLHARVEKSSGVITITR